MEVFLLISGKEILLVISVSETAGQVVLYGLTD